MGTHGEPGATECHPNALSLWNTPKTSGMNGARDYDSKRGVGLNTQVLWYTPDVPNGGRGTRGRITPTGQTEDGRKQQVGLNHQAQAWPTPAARDVKGANANDTHATDQLANVASRCGLQAPQRGPSGLASSPSPPRLNPRFVEWLMGFPIGWTDSAPVATEWCRWKQRMRTELLRLAS